MSSSEDGPLENPPPQPRQISGTLVVIGMLLMGVAATTVMFVYWHFHTKPFRPLTEAIGRTYKNSLPKVEGGRHKRGPMTLRVAFRVPFPPETDEAAAQLRLREICELIRKHQDLTGYEHVDIHMFQMVPEEAAKSRHFRLTPEEVSGLR